MVIDWSFVLVIRIWSFFQEEISKLSGSEQNNIWTFSFVSLPGKKQKQYNSNLCLNSQVCHSFLFITVIFDFKNHPRE